MKVILTLNFKAVNFFYINSKNNILCAYSFWSISCKMPGSAHDANVLRQSDLFQRSHLLPKVKLVTALIFEENTN